MSTNDPARSPEALATFVSRTGPDDADPIPVLTPVVRIGQGPQNDLVLDDDTVSTQHARLEFATGGWRLTDLESRNGTFVDGVRLAPGVPTPLPDNALVTFGAMELGFLASAGADPESAAAAYTPPERTVPLAERAPFRLPVWLLALIILMVVLLVTLYVVFSGDPGGVEPVTEPVTALLVGRAA